MKRLPCIVVLVAGLAVAAPAQELPAPAAPLAEATAPAGLSVGLRAGWDHREFDRAEGEEQLGADLTRVTARVGANVLPFLLLWGDLGWGMTDIADEQGDGGLAWGVGARARLVEFPLETSPVVGRTSSVWLGLIGDYRHLESSADEGDFEWGEFRGGPSVHYVVNRKGDATRSSWGSLALEAHAAVLFASGDGSYADEDIESQNDFAALLGGQWLLTSGWAVEAELVLYGAEEREIDLGFSYTF